MVISFAALEKAPAHLINISQNTFSVTVKLFAFF